MADSCAPHKHTLECDLIEMAKPVVLGVLTAQQNNNPRDAAMLLDGYAADARSMGAKNETAWALLFSAATMWIAAMVEVNAALTASTPKDALTDLAMAYASRTV